MTPDVKNMGIVTDGIRHLSAREAFMLCKEGAILVDLRTPYETDARQFDAENVLLFPKDDLKEDYTALPKDRLLILADGVGLHSKEALVFLRSKGYEKIANLAGGIVDWEREGYHVITDKNEMMRGQCACMLKSKTGKKLE
ncbi:MAG: rhodanese-like domain-containing protein [Bacteroidales bacterium]|nr:rhodanese-like domain-containing protein [Bacteroidales bacterium]